MSTNATPTVRIATAETNILGTPVYVDDVMIGRVKSHGSARWGYSTPGGRDFCPGIYRTRKAAVAHLVTRVGR